jgi:hypothetical protein
MVNKTVENSSCMATRARCPALRISCWAVALALAGAEAWATRFLMNPDGVSYLDIGDAYGRHDWHNAINAYWSPLYSWILGFFINVVKPTPYWEYPLVHLVNFLIFVGALACFEFFLTSFVSQQQERNRDLLAYGQMGIPVWTWYLLGYSLFIWTSLILMGLRVANPDLLVFAFTCLDFAMLVRIHREPSKRNFLLLGVALGVGYLGKAVLFPLGFVFLLTAAISTKAYRQAFASGLAFLVIAAPFIASISYNKHRLTFGDSGRLTFAGYISNLEPWFPGDGGDFYIDGIGHAENIDNPSAFSKELIHPVKKIFERPATYFFDGPIGGTYPFWYDISYWQDGIRPFFQLSRELQVLRYAILYSLALTWGLFYQLPVTIALLLLFLLAPRPSVCFVSIAKSWYLILPAFIGYLMYAIVHFEYRYVAPFICIGWLVLFSGIQVPASTGFRILIRSLVSIVAISQIGFPSYAVSEYAKNSDFQHDLYSQAAQALLQQGLQPGARIAMISEDPLGQGGPFVARLARLHIVAQVNTPSQFWSATSSTQSQVLESFADCGSEAVVSYRPPQTTQGWRRLGETDYYMFKLTPGEQSISMLNRGMANDSDPSR